MTRAFALSGKAKAHKPYHYTQCGLDDVFLLNGVSEHDTLYGSGVSVYNVEGLHKAIAMNIVCNKAMLNGREMRFLRKLMDLTQAELAGWLGVNVQTVARWEKGQSEISGPADKLMRLLYLASEFTDVKVLEQVRALAELDAGGRERQEFEVSEKEWRSAA